MKTWIKCLISALIGVASGFAGGVLFHKKLNDIQFEEVSEEDMAKIESKVSTPVRAIEAPKSEDIADAILNEIKNTEDDVDKIRIAAQGKTPYIRADHETKMAYEKMWNSVKAYSDEENADRIPTLPDDAEDSDVMAPISIDEDLNGDILEAMELEEVEPGSNAVEPPHEIGLSAYYNERTEFDKTTIHWYSDDVWMDDHEEIIPNPTDLIGLDPKPLFDQSDPNGDPDIRFVRREQYGTDFEIIRHKRSWVDAKLDTLIGE